MNNILAGTYCYMVNPDVVLREEDEEGGLLFNPDTNQVKVLNLTGLFIWKLCDGKTNLNTILEAIKQEFESVPDEQVENDAQNFIDGLMQAGFIGTPEN
jgi:hypothetical protein